jgi:predicted GNAT superfamily acetyltransferase
MTGDAVTVRSLDTPAEFEACVALQRETWGGDFSGCVPAAVLMIARKVGGVVAGALDERGHLLGFVFGLTGYTEGRPVHWSHMLAVRDTARGAGLGLRLKLFQRRLLLENGVTTARWTFDPLVARNAHLNLNRLGAVVVDYVEDMYGDSNSPLHAGLGTDRFVVEWHLADPAVERAIAGGARPDFAPFADAPIAAADRALPAAPRVRIEIPADIHAVLARAPGEAARWRTGTRRAFRWYLSNDYRVAAFRHTHHSARACYGLVTP